MRKGRSLLAISAAYTSMGDMIDIDGDGCIDEEIADNRDNDGDGCDATIEIVPNTFQSNDISRAPIVRFGR